MTYMMNYGSENVESILSNIKKQATEENIKLTILASQEMAGENIHFEDIEQSL